MFEICPMCSTTLAIVMQLGVNAKKQPRDNTAERIYLSCSDKKEIIVYEPLQYLRIYVENLHYGLSMW